MTRAAELSKKILQARIDYYNEQPSVSDLVFDTWVDELKKLDPENHAITNIGAPLPVSSWKKSAHTVLMQSLNKVNTPEEFLEWAKKVDCDEFLVMDKLDGISISLTFDKDSFAAVTRGDGEIGEDITTNVRRMRGIGFIENSNIRGEIVLEKTAHKDHFPEYANPRNAASGIAKRYDGDGSDKLSVICYTLNDSKFETELETVKHIETNGFRIPRYKICNANEVIALWREYQQSIRESLNYDIDGLVVRVNDIQKQLSLGEENHRPKGAIAFKFEAAAAETVLTDIIWQTGPTGKVTPVGKFDEVELVGSKITRASLYNHSYIKDLKLDIGAKIIVIRANDVIPRIEEVSQGTGTTAKKPDTCPSCGSKIYDDGEYLVCRNHDCPAKVLGRISRWVEKNGMMDVGDKVLQKMIVAGLIKDIGDLYRVTKDQLAALDRMGGRSAENVINEIGKFREVTLANFVGALGINCIGTTAAGILIGHGYDSLEKLQKLSISQAENVPGFGSVRAGDFVNGMKANCDRIADILSAGVTIKVKTIGKLTGKSFCFTGSSNLSRKELHALVENSGGTVEKRVVKGLDYLVSADADSGSAKSIAAKKNGTKVISEKEFLYLL